MLYVALAVFGLFAAVELSLLFSLAFTFSLPSLGLLSSYFWNIGIHVGFVASSFLLYRAYSRYFYTKTRDAYRILGNHFPSCKIHSEFAEKFFAVNGASQVFFTKESLVKKLKELAALPSTTEFLDESFHGNDVLIDALTSYKDDDGDRYVVGSHLYQMTKLDKVFVCIKWSSLTPAIAVVSILISVAFTIVFMCCAKDINVSRACEAIKTKGYSGADLYFSEIYKGIPGHVDISCRNPSPVAYFITGNDTSLLLRQVGYTKYSEVIDKLVQQLPEKQLSSDEDDVIR